MGEMWKVCTLPWGGTCTFKISATVKILLIPEPSGFTSHMFDALFCPFPGGAWSYSTRKRRAHGMKNPVCRPQPVFFVSLLPCLEASFLEKYMPSCFPLRIRLLRGLPLLLFLATSGHRRVWIAGRDIAATVTGGTLGVYTRERAKGEGLKAREKSPCLQKLLWGQVNVMLGMKL